MKRIKLTLDDGRDYYPFIDKITDIIRKDKGTGCFVSCGSYDNTATVKETPEEIFRLIDEQNVEFELIEGVELKTEIELTEFDRLEDFVNNVGIVHEVLQIGKHQIIRLESHEVSMNFRFYENKFKDWHIIEKGVFLVNKNRNER